MSQQFCSHVKTWCKPKHPPLHTAFVFVLCLVVYETKNNVFLRIPVVRDEKFYNYFATAVSHASVSHLLSNVTGLLMFGTLLEIVHGTLANFFIFWISAGTGVLGEAWLNDGNVLYSGASPGLYGLIGGFAAHVLLNWNEAPLKLLWLSFIVFQSIEVALFYVYDEEYRNGVAHASHFFGFGQGICVGLLTLRNLKEYRFEIVLQGIAIAFSVAIIVTPAIFISMQSYPKTKI
jgi:membrane associated rhomboid family serine protease